MIIKHSLFVLLTFDNPLSATSRHLDYALRQCIGAVCTTYGSTALVVRVGARVEVLVRLSPHVSVTKLVGNLKSICADTLGEVAPSPLVWSHDVSVASVSFEDVASLRDARSTSCLAPSCARPS